MLWSGHVGLPYTTHCMPPEKTWCEALTCIVKDISDPLVLLVLEDYWACKSMDTRRFQLLFGAMHDGKADKADLQFQVNHWQHVKADDGFLESQQTADYRASTQAAIWKRDYLLKKLQVGGSAWDFELSCGSRNDSARIIGLPEASLTYANVMLKGTPDPYQIARIDAYDWEWLHRENALPEDFVKIRPV